MVLCGSMWDLLNTGIICKYQHFISKNGELVYCFNWLLWDKKFARKDQTNLQLRDCQIYEHPLWAIKQSQPSKLLNLEGICYKKTENIISYQTCAEYSEF